MSTNEQPTDIFLQLTRYLLVDHAFFAQLLGVLPKQKRVDMDCAIAISWLGTQPIVCYQEQLLNELLLQEQIAIQTIIHELFHLLLNHISKPPKENDLLFNLSADIQVWSWMQDYFKFVPDYIKQYSSIFPDAKQQSLEDIQSTLSKSPAFKESIINVDHKLFRAHTYWSIKEQETPSSLWQLWWRPLQLSLPVQLLDDGLRIRLEQTINPFKIKSWRIILRQFATNASRTYNKSSLRRPSKRYGSIPGTVRKRRQNLLAIIDTSGSVEAPLLQDFFGEIQWLYRQGAHIQLLQADHKIQDTANYKGSMPDWIWGRGATSFDPAIEYANENGPYDGVLYFTDGKGKKPQIKSKWPIRWIAPNASNGTIEIKPHIT